jgi:hypothetical protein
VAGNLDPWPQVSGAPGDMLEFDFERPVNGKLETRRARGRLLSISGDFELWSPRMCMTAI